jgi:hypothetical protein
VAGLATAPQRDRQVSCTDHDFKDRCSVDLSQVPKCLNAVELEKYLRERGTGPWWP